MSVVSGKRVPLTGVEPAILGLEDRCLIHWATEARIREKRKIPFPEVIINIEEQKKFQVHFFNHIFSGVVVSHSAIFSPQ